MKCSTCGSEDINNETYRNMRNEKTYIGIYCNNCKRNKIIFYSKDAYIQLSKDFEGLEK